MPNYPKPKLPSSTKPHMASESELRKGFLAVHQHAQSIKETPKTLACAKYKNKSEMTEKPIPNPKPDNLKPNLERVNTKTKLKLLEIGVDLNSSPLLDDHSGCKSMSPKCKQMVLKARFPPYRLGE